MQNNNIWRARLMCGAAVVAMALPLSARAEAADFNIAPQPLTSALKEFGIQSQYTIVAQPDVVASKMTMGLSQSAEPEAALTALLAGTGLSYRREGDTFLIVRADGPQGGSAAGAGAEVEALIVTAQKREEDIQDVPIAISAFTQEALERSQVAGGPDLITQVPNMTFTKTNFSSYSIQLRGIGTQAISATVDPAVAVAFNNTPFIRNRFFEQEFYDLQRVEVLRGPQGTLYGRNATAGVVNLISQKARLDTYEAKLSGDIANYNSTRVEGMLNIPLANDVAALRIAGAWTKREGYSVNELTGNPIDGRDLWSTRVSLRFAPTDRLDANLIWEHFEENDDRLRSGKQLCKMDVVDEVAGIATPNFYQRLPEMGQSAIWAGVQASFSQGCAPASLYSPDSFQKTNPLALAYFTPLTGISLPITTYPFDHPLRGMPVDPYSSRTQSKDLRIIEAAVDPGYLAKTDIVALQASFDISDTLTLASETAWGSDFIFSTQDYNRFAGSPGSFDVEGNNEQWLQRGLLSEDGFFCDPQIGCSDRLVAMDLSTARSRQFSQELRLASDFDGPFNFSLGGNFLRYDTEDKYYVFINTLTMVSAYFTRGRNGQFTNTDPWVPGATDNRDCLINGMAPPNYNVAEVALQCTYIDPNPITNLNDLGHNYFLSKNPYKLISYAAFGEAYYKLADNLKITAGLRWTVDKKEAPVVPSWLLAANTAGYPVVETVRQEWREPTGRLAIDWKPDLSFTDETMIYASASRGYKAGGMNPPPYGKVFTGEQASTIGSELLEHSAVHPRTFEPEYVNALELGAKNVLLDGALTLNLAGFYYDYQGYQLSQIVDRSAVTTNFDATVWGLELESDWRPRENLRFGLKFGYEKTKVADGMRAIDVMDRVAGHEGWLLAKPFPTTPSNCILPAWLMVGNPQGFNGTPNINPWLVNVGGKGTGNPSGCEMSYLLGWDPGAGEPYTFDPLEDSQFPFRHDVDYGAWSTDLADYPCWPTDPSTGQPATIGVRDYPGVDPACLAAMSNNGEGFFKDLSGKELPNAPHMTATITADYTVPLPSEWLMTLHTDLYYQSESWTRIFNTEGYDKLKAYTNVNLAAIFTNEDAGWKVMAYVKNVFDRDSITGAFLNSDDSGLTTNVFLTEPRLYGMRLTKDFSGGPWWTGVTLDHEGPFPLAVELGGTVQHSDAPYEMMHADWINNLPASIAPEDLQNRDLDWGDERSLKVTYNPNVSPWSLAAEYRQGRTNTDMARDSISLAQSIEACAFPSFHPFYSACQPPYQFNGLDRRWFAFVDAPIWSDAEARSQEKHEIADLTVGYHFASPARSQSTISAGLRYADFQSDTHWAVNAQTDWNIPDGYRFTFADPSLMGSVKRRHLLMDARREFSGTGPILTWNGAMPVWGDAQSGRLNIEGSVTAGVLIGKRETTVAGEDRTVFHEGDVTLAVGFNTETSFIQSMLPVASDNTVEIDTTRSEDATVPILDLSLGLSYDVGRIKVSTGYRWERYFDVLDVGQDEAATADRTIDGPYFKLAVGFGG